MHPTLAFLSQRACTSWKLMPETKRHPGFASFLEGMIFGPFLMWVLLLALSSSGVFACGIKCASYLQFLCFYAQF